jgi:hypothetical protein
LKSISWYLRPYNLYRFSPPYFYVKIPTIMGKSRSHNHLITPPIIHHKIILYNIIDIEFILLWWHESCFFTNGILLFFGEGDDNIKEYLQM